MRRVLPVLLVLISAGQSQAYFPPNCNARNAATDYIDADAVVIARVIKIERKVSDSVYRGKDGAALKDTDYFATLKVGRSIRGNLKADEEFLMYEGGYIKVKEDNSEVTWLGQQTHARVGFEIDGIYLLFINSSHGGRGNSIVFAPRSCHFSVHKISAVNDEKTSAQKLMVHESTGMREKPKDPVLLEEFLETKKKDAESEKKAEAAKVKDGANK